MTDEQRAARRALIAAHAKPRRYALQRLLAGGRDWETVSTHDTEAQAMEQRHATRLWPNRIRGIQ